ncbi:MAG: glycosyltransferase [Cetobacterium sp.]
MKKVSVIVPVYNVEKYLDKCLKSIVNQTLKDIEIIIVNDGTKDNSEEIILKYEKKDKRIKYYKKENGGLSDARNYGLEKSTGEYISFIDSDDFIDSDMLEKMYNNAKENESDIIVCGFKSVYESGIKRTEKKYDKIKFKDILEISFAWNKIYNHSFLKTLNFRFPVGKHFEDMYCIPELAIKTSKITSISETPYNYVIRENSITTKRDNSKIFDLLEACIYNKNLVELTENKELKKEWIEYSKGIKKIFFSFINNYTFKFKLKNFNKTIQYLKSLEIVNIFDYLILVCSMFYPKYYIKNIYLNLKRKV